MKTLRDLYKIGRGPSSSHTMGPGKIAELFMREHPDADKIIVKLYGSLAMTGKGHGTDKVLKEIIDPVCCDIIFDTKSSNLPHPNTLDIAAIVNGETVDHWRAFSTGGGSIFIEGHESDVLDDIYPHNDLTSIIAYCQKKGLRLWEYVEKIEGIEIMEYLLGVWKAMCREIEEGLRAKDCLPGILHLQRKAGMLYECGSLDESATTRENRIVCSYAYAVGEQNAAGKEIVTAPTCGSSGVLPAVLYYFKNKGKYTDDEIIHALATGGLIGNLIKSNASISGAECGCQAEIGSACSMASAALAELFGANHHQIEYAAEIAMEHMMGLTCEPVGGMVQIPCIERNAVAAMRAINSVSLSKILADTRKISFDLIIQTMYETGRDMSEKYCETSKGGLAKMYKI